jgi:hypothetical protein
LRDDALNLLRLALQLPTQTLNNIDIHTQTCHVSSLSLCSCAFRMKYRCRS